MKIVFVSNYFNHHQHSLCQELYELTDGNFWFVATAPMRQERRELGYGMDHEPEYVLRSYESAHSERTCQSLILEADAVIAGSAPENMIAPAIRRGALVFRYSERPLKQGKERKKYLPRRILWRLRNPKNKPVYLLSASAYASADYRIYGLFCGKAYRWGYFPQTKIYAWEELVSGKLPTRILWAGRFLDWKHPDDAIRAAAMLRDAGYQAELWMIGTGPMEQQLRELTAKLGLEDRVTFLGTMKPSQVRLHMEQAGIFLFTSDKREGWGAVVNEAMNSGCAVVASHAAGAPPYLIRHGQNGMLYQSGNIQDLGEQVKILLDDPAREAELGRKAYETVANLWNASEAARRLLTLTDEILAGNSAEGLYEEGPCSPAPLLRDDWM